MEKEYDFKVKVLRFLLRFLNKKTILDTILNESEKEALNYVDFGFLAKKGYWESWKSHQPIDHRGRPLPWVTYSFIDFIKDRFRKDMILFEYGSGNSSLYYSKLVKEVYTVEHDWEWYSKIKDQLPGNVYLSYLELETGGHYSRAALESGKRYDLIIVDGRDRVNCLMNSLDCIAEDGVIVLDDSERESYKKGVNQLKNAGYKSLDFWGISPGIMAYNKCTSVFYKENNILGI